MISGIGTRSALGVQSLVEMRRQLDELQRQLGTGQKSDTYAGIGLDRGLLVGLRNRVSSIDGYASTINNVDVRIDLAQSALGRLTEVGRTVKAAAFQSTDIGSNGTTIAQSTAYSSLGEILGLLNTQIGDRYIFSGSGADRPSVASVEQIMDGDGARAGFKQVVSERRQADLGASGLGRVLISAPTATSVQVAEDVAGSVFGFKLSGINSGLANSAVTGPAGAPQAMSVNLTGLPNEGETLQFRFALPDGSSETVTLTATTSTTPAPNEFTIGLTLSWYTGENGGGPARATATARVDTSITVSYGLRANEEGIRWTIQNVAALAAVTFSPTDPDATARAGALHARIGTNLDVPPGTQKVEDIQAELAGAQATLLGAAERHRQTKSALAGMMEQIEGVPTEEVAAQVLALQVRLQASLQTTSLLYQTSLVNYI